MAFNLGNAWNSFLGGSTSTTTTETTKPVKGSNTGLIVGGIILGVVIIVGIVLLVRVNKKKAD